MNQPKLKPIALGVKIALHQMRQQKLRETQDEQAAKSNSDTKQT